MAEDPKITTPYRSFFTHGSQVRLVKSDPDEVTYWEIYDKNQAFALPGYTLGNDEEEIRIAIKDGSHIRLIEEGSAGPGGLVYYKYPIGVKAPILQYRDSQTSPPYQQSIESLTPIQQVAPFSCFDDRKAGCGGIFVDQRFFVTMQYPGLVLPTLGGTLDLTILNSRIADGLTAFLGGGSFQDWRGGAVRTGSWQCGNAQTAGPSGFNYGEPYFVQDDAIVYPGIPTYPGPVAFRLRTGSLTSSYYRWEATSDRTYYEVYEGNTAPFRTDRTLLTYLNGGKRISYFGEVGTGGLGFMLNTSSEDIPGTVYYNWTEYSHSNIMITEVLHGLTEDGDRSWQLEYEPGTFHNKLTKVTDPNSGAIETGYDAGSDFRVVDQSGFVTYYEFTYYQWNSGFRISKVIPPVGSPTLFDHYPLERTMVRYRQEPELAIYFTYDIDFHRVSSVQFDKGGPTQYYFFSPDTGTNSATVDRLGRPYYFRYDEQLNTTASLNPLGEATYFGYDQNNRLIRQQDALGRVTYYDRDASGNNTRILDPLNQETTMSYVRGGLMTSRTLPEGGVSNFGYDQYGRQIQAEDPEGNATYFSFDSRSNLLHSVGPQWANLPSMAEATTYYEYDALNRPIRVLMPADSETVTEYTPRPADGPSATHAFIESDTWRSSYFEYDGLARMVRGVDPDGGETLNDFLGSTTKVSKSQDPRGYGSYFAYDGQERLVRQLDAEGNSTYFGYDDAGNLLRIQNPRWIEGVPKHHTTYFVYDELNRPILQFDEYLNYEQTVYDSVGNIKLKIDKRFGPTIFDYDDLNRVVSVQNPASKIMRMGYDSNGNLVRNMDFRDNTTYFEFDLANRKTASISPEGEISRVGYDSASNIVRRMNPRGYTTYFGFDAQNRLVSQKDALSFETLLQLNAVGETTAAVDARGHSSYFGYDSRGFNAWARNQVGATVYFGYDANGNLTQRMDPLGNTTYFEFDSINRPIKTTDALGNEYLSEYNSIGEISYFTLPLPDNQTVTVSNGFDRLNRLAASSHPVLGETALGYDADSNLDLVGLPSDPGSPRSLSAIPDPLGRPLYEINAAGGRIRNEFDANGNVIEKTWPNENSTLQGFDKDNRLVRIMTASGTTYFGYDVNGNLSHRITPMGFTTYYDHNAVDSLSAISNPDGGVVSSFYDGNRNLTSTKPPIGNSVYFGYDEANRLIARQGLNGSTSYFVYDLASNLVSTVNTRNGVTNLGYDPLYRMVKATSPIGGSSYFAYSPQGLRLRALDPLERATYFFYDGGNRPTCTQDALLNNTYYFYDGANNLSSVFDQLGRGTYFLYDENQNNTADRDAAGKFYYFRYDPNNNLIGITDRNGSIDRYIVDGSDRHVRTDYGLSGPLAGYGSQPYGPSPYGQFEAAAIQRSVYFGYDKDDSLVRTLDNWGPSYFGYDSMHRRTASLTPRGDSVYYSYNVNSKLTALVYPQDGVAAYFGYDSAIHLTQIKAPSQYGTYYSYDSGNLVERSLLGNSMAAYFSYDLAGNVLNRRYVDQDGAPVAYFDYTRDVAGRIMSIGRESDLAVYYSYDALDRLTEEIWRKQSDHSQVYGFWYEYDPTGNRLRERREFAAGEEWQSSYFHYTVTNELDMSVSLPGGTGTYYEYDNNGALLKEFKAAGTTYYVYGVERLVTSVTPATGARWDFAYDALNSRYAMNRGGTASYFQWLGENALEERDATGALIARYCYGTSSVAGIGSAIEVFVPGSPDVTYLLAMDHRGTVHKLVEQDGTLVGTRHYNGFGVLLGESGSWPIDLAYQANWLTIQIGSRYYGLSKYRLYDPEVGRFLSRDPSGMANGLNLYRAFANNPAMIVDPNGMGDEDPEGENDGVDTDDPTNEGIAAEIKRLEKRLVEIKADIAAEIRKGADANQTVIDGLEAEWNMRAAVLKEKSDIQTMMKERPVPDVKKYVHYPPDPKKLNPGHYHMSYMETFGAHGRPVTGYINTFPPDPVEEAGIRLAAGVYGVGKGTVSLVGGILKQVGIGGARIINVGGYLASSTFTNDPWILIPWAERQNRDTVDSLWNGLVAVFREEAAYDRNPEQYKTNRLRQIQTYYEKADPFTTSSDVSAFVTETGLGVFLPFAEVRGITIAKRISTAFENTARVARLQFLEFTRPLRRPGGTYDLVLNAPKNFLGWVNNRGVIKIPQWIQGTADFLPTFRHESAHSFLLRLFDNYPRGVRIGWRYGLRYYYRHSPVLRGLEEAIAETYGTFNPLRGLYFPIAEGYVEGSEIAWYLASLTIGGYGANWVYQKFLGK